MLKDDFDATEFINYLSKARTYKEINIKYRMSLEQLKCMLIALNYSYIIEVNNKKYKIKERR